MKYISRLTAICAIIGIVLTACSNRTDNSSADNQKTVSADTTSSEVISTSDKESFGSFEEGSATKISEDEIPKDFVELTPFDVNEKEYRFMVEKTKYILNLSNFDSNPQNFDAFYGANEKTEDHYIEKRPVMTEEEALEYGMDIFRAYCINITGNEAGEDYWELLCILRDDVNDAWGISLCHGPLVPGPSFDITFSSNGEMIYMGLFGE